VSLRSLYLLRAAGTWVLTRLILTAALLFTPDTPSREALTPNLGVLIAVATTSLALGFVDVARRRERALLGNFGVSRTHLAAWLALPAIAAESTLLALFGR
jgi:hypothetical protein